jgi:hypothetical protein
VHALRSRAGRTGAVPAALLVILVSGCGGSPSAPQPFAGPLSASLANRAGATLQVDPPTMTFVKKESQNAQLTPNTDAYSEKNTCVKKRILKSVKYYAYGIFSVTPGKTPGTCVVTFTDALNKSTAQMTVVNTIQ